LAGLSPHEGRTPERLDRVFGDPLVDRLFPPLAAGVHFGLERMAQALAALDDPHLAYDTIHIGGTNGKGSVTASVGAVLRAAGRRTACYTSPHLCSFRERLLIDGAPIAEDLVLKYAAEVRETVTSLGLPFFEAVTLLAMHAFAREGVEVGVMEVGLGGRLDATNLVRPRVSAVTNVAMDHSEYLGDTLLAIAREKAGIMKPGVPFVTAETSSEILGLFRSLAADVGAPLKVVPPGAAHDVEVTRRYTALRLDTETWGELQLRTPLVGLHQAVNAALAVSVLEELEGDLRPGRDAVVEGLARVVHPGRDEVLRVRGGAWLLDIAHNTAGIRSLVDTIDRLELSRPLVALVGVQGDKDWQTMLPELFSRMDVAILTQPPTVPPERRWDPVAVAAQVESLTEVHVVPDFVEAVCQAEEKVRGGTVVVTGSVHTVGSAMSFLGVDPYGR
jgi:dihydrofolate synthase/folylpolyglutamate synthase